jgi:hypothetical protein
VSAAPTTPALYRRVEPRAGLQWVAIAGGVAIAGWAIAVQPAEGWAGILTAATFGMALALGGGVFLAVQAAAGARWWFPLRGIPLLLARTLAAPAAALVLCLVFGLHSLYPWTRPEVAAAPVVAAKRAWLNEPLFLARALVILVAWFSLIGALSRRLGELCAHPSPPAWRRLARTAVGFSIVYAITSSVAAWDWTMSLEPEWFSTMYGVYAFAGTFLGGIAAIAVLAILLARAGMLAEGPADGVLHDLGKLLFAFATFWAYIWFCQYLLIWYANMPEETGHHAARLGGGWSTLFYLNPVLNWVVPFVVLLGAGPKRRPTVLLQVALVVLIGRWLDAYLLIAPALGASPGFPLAALAATFAVLGGMGVLWRRGLARAAAGGTAGLIARAER